MLTHNGFLFKARKGLRNCHTNPHTHLVCVNRLHTTQNPNTTQRSPWRSQGSCARKYCARPEKCILSNCSSDQMWSTEFPKNPKQTKKINKINRWRKCNTRRADVTTVCVLSACRSMQARTLIRPWSGPPQLISSVVTSWAGPVKCQIYELLFN